MVPALYVCVGAVVVDAFVILGLYGIPGKFIAFAQERCGPAYDIFDEHGVVVSLFCDKFLIGSFQDRIYLTG